MCVLFCQYNVSSKLTFECVDCEADIDYLGIVMEQWRWGTCSYIDQTGDWLVSYLDKIPMTCSKGIQSIYWPM